MNCYVTGIGAISAIGNNAEECFRALSQEKTGIRQGKQPHTSAFKVGEISLSDEDLKAVFELKTNGSRTALLGMIAAKEAFSGHSLSSEIRTGLISGTSVGGMDLSEKEYANFLDGKLHNSETYRHHASGTTTEEIARELGIDGFMNTVSTACSSAANAIMMGARMMQAGLLDRVIVGGTDSLTRFTIAGFRSLMIFDDEWCRPFDESRKGLNLGEGAGFLVLESRRSLVVSKKQPLALISGWNNSADAYHQTASSPDGQGAVRSMTAALEMAGLEPDQIDYINAHGTATPNNDESESAAIQNVFGINVPPFSSTKAYTGHTLAASGGIEAVFAVQAIREGVLYPNLNFSKPIPEILLTPQLTFETGKSIRHVLSNSFGFGGNNSSLIISGIE